MDVLHFFSNYDDEVLKDFIEFSFEFICNNVKNKAFSNAAQRLGTDSTCVENVISKLAFILLESVKLNTTEADLFKNLEGVLHPSKISIIWEGLQLRKEKLVELIGQTRINCPQYTSLNWRLESTLASKLLQQQTDVNMMMNLTLKKRTGLDQLCFTTDIPNLFHLTQVLESALNESKSSHVRKVQRSFK